MREVVVCVLKNPDSFKLKEVKISKYDHLYIVDIKPNSFFITPIYTTSLKSAKRIIAQEIRCEYSPRLRWSKV